MKALLKNIKENWVLIAAVVSMIITFTTYGTRITNAENDISDIQSQQAELTTLKVDVAVIKQKTTDSDKKIDDLSNKVDYIIDNMRR